MALALNKYIHGSKFLQIAKFVEKICECAGLHTGFLGGECGL